MNKIIMALVFVLIVSMLIVPAATTAQAVQSKGTDSPETNSKKVCGDKLCNVGKTPPPLAIAPKQLGSDRDEHGCIPSAGYTWSEKEQKCLRPWEKPGVSKMPTRSIPDVSIPEDLEKLPNVTTESDDLSLLFVLTSEEGQIQQYGDEVVLTLSHVSPNIIWFADRPHRDTGHITTSQFISSWPEGEDSFAVDPPNAALDILDDETSFNVMILELLNPDYYEDEESRTLQFRINILESATGGLQHFEKHVNLFDIPEKFGQSALFIDNFVTHEGSRSTELVNFADKLFECSEQMIDKNQAEQKAAKTIIKKMLLDLLDERHPDKKYLDDLVTKRTTGQQSYYDIQQTLLTSDKATHKEKIGNMNYINKFVYGEKATIEPPDGRLDPFWEPYGRNGIMHGVIGDKHNLNNNVADTKEFIKKIFVDRLLRDPTQADLDQIYDYGKMYSNESNEQTDQHWLDSRLWSYYDRFGFKFERDTKDQVASRLDPKLNDIYLDKLKHEPSKSDLEFYHDEFFIKGKTIQEIEKHIEITRDQCRFIK